ncbi:MAG: hypothetical protein ACQEXQ_19165 [Bacillota bacterium]
MKPSKTEPQWYQSLRVDPLKKKTFTEDLAAQIKTRALSPAKKQTRTKGAAWLAIGVLSVGLLFYAGQSETLKSWLGIGKNAAIAEKSTPMTYYPSRIDQLLPMKQKPISNPVKSISLPAKNGLQSVTIHLYEDTKNVKLVTAYLEDGGVWFEAGIVSNEGLHLVDVKLDSWTGKEIQITGPVVDWTIKLLRYNETKMIWEINDFEGHPTKEIDLDGDGIQELVSAEENAVPPMVTVHHWNRESKVFESAQVDIDASKMYNIDREKQLTLTYSYLFQEEGNWFIEFGVGDEWHQFLQYQNGVLKEVKLADNRSRLMELRKQQNHIH